MNNKLKNTEYMPWYFFLVKTCCLNMSKLGTNTTPSSAIFICCVSVLGVGQILLPHFHQMFSFNGNIDAWRVNFNSVERLERSGLFASIRRGFSIKAGKVVQKWQDRFRRQAPLATISCKYSCYLKLAFATLILHNIDCVHYFAFTSSIYSHFYLLKPRLSRMLKIKCFHW